MTKKTNNYKDSGVNVQEGQDFINDIKDELNDFSYSLLAIVDALKPS